jgi:hypothetical protein
VVSTEVPSHLARAEAYKKHLKKQSSTIKKNELEMSLKSI